MLVFGCTFVNGLVQTNVYAYINEQVMDLGMAFDRNVTGYYVGILASMFMLGRAFSSPICRIENSIYRNIYFVNFLE
jgi:hypothetical protein